MPNFKDPTGNLHFLEDSSFSHLLPKGSVEISEAEAIELQKPPPETPEQIVERLKAELRAIEQAEIMPRQTRELNIKLAEFLSSQVGSSLEEDIIYQKLVKIDTKCKKIREEIQSLELSSKKEINYE